jgi:signal transduction histidine kinase
VPRAAAGVRNFHVTIPQSHVLLEHLRHAFGPLIKDELALIKEQEHRPQHVVELEEIENALVWLDAAVVVPLFVNKELTGLIVLGDKLSGEPYLQDDTNFLAALAPQAATALENARLYQESLEFGNKLKAEVERATHELAIANEQLRDLDKAKSEFLSVASHQLYTPLTALRGYLSMLREGDFGKTPAKQQPVINILEKSSERLIALIKNLLDISRIESGRLELNLESVDLATMITELVRDLIPNAAAKQLKLKFKKPNSPLPHVVADRQRLRQVMLNLIDNAIKYTESGRIDVTLRRIGDDIIFAVTDTGKGLTQQEIGKLFNKFTRVGGADRFHTEGAGLGLYVAKQIVKEHHGNVEVTSPGMDQGSTFSVRLPIEGTARSLKAGERVSVEIKAAGT